MRAIFLTVLDMSLSATWLILAVVLMRIFFHKASRAIVCLLWGFVGIRLCVPFVIESPIGLLPQKQVAVGMGHTEPMAGTAANGTDIFLWVWIIGGVGLVAYAVISFLLLRRRVTEAAHLGEDVYICDRIDTPFLLGIFRPRIYLPPTMSEKQKGYVIAHERAHAQRCDHVWKLLGFCLLIVHWFNPLTWLAYVLLCRDMEMACDEKAIRFMSLRERKAYSHTLLACSVKRRTLAAYPIAFGEGRVKNRIRLILRYKKPTLWGTVATVLVMCLTVISFMTNSASSTRLPESHPRNTGWIMISDFYGDGMDNLCAYKTVKSGAGEEYTVVILEEDGLYYAGEYAGKFDADRVSFEQQLLCCKGVYPYADIDVAQKKFALYSSDGRVLMQ